MSISVLSLMLPGSLWETGYTPVGDTANSSAGIEDEGSGGSRDAVDISRVLLRVVGYSGRRTL